MILAKVLRESNERIEEMIYIDSCQSQGTGEPSHDYPFLSMKIDQI